MDLAQLLVRLAIAVAISLLGIATFWGWNHFQLRRLGAATGGRLRGLEAMQTGVPGVLYFTTPDCQVCITTQKPALSRLQAELGAGVQIVEVDATVQPELADYWGVLSVPTTFIIDSGGQPRHINHGLTSKDKLRRQIEEARQGLALAGGEPAEAQQSAGAEQENAG
jgi:thioredoxin-like negative regulator of GroEL